MAVGSGIGGQLGFAAETTYGTSVTPNHFLPADKAELKLKPTFAQGNGIVAGQFLDAASQRIKTMVQGTGMLDVELQSGGLGLLLQALMGTTVTPVVQGATAAYLQTHTMADVAGKSLTVQVGVPDTTGTSRPYTLLGSKVTDAQFSFDISATGPCMGNFSLDGANLVETTPLAAASYATGLRPFVGTDVVIKAGTFGSEAQVDGVRKVDVKFARPMRADRFYLGNAGVKREPIMNGRMAVTGTVTADFVDKTLWADRFAANTPFSLTVTATGALIAGAFSQTFGVTLPRCFIDGDTPTLASEDVVTGAFPFRCLWDGANQPFITYISTDVTL